MGDEGLEPVVPENAVMVQNRIELRQSGQVAAESGGAESGAVGAEDEFLSVPDDPRLLGLIDVWPALSEDSRDAIVRLAGHLAGDTAENS